MLRRETSSLDGRTFQVWFHLHVRTPLLGEDTPLGDALRRPRWGVPFRFDIEQPSNT